MSEYWQKQAQMFKGEMGALGRQGLNDARNILMGDLGGERTAGTTGYPTSQEVTDSFGGTYEQRMGEARKGKEQAKEADPMDKDAKSKDREMGD
jgi:hypothetical protein